MSERIIHGEIQINAAVDRVYSAWTTESGIRSFFSKNCKVDARVGGPMEIYFNMEAPPGSRGSEGCVFLALQPNQMISFSWNSPPHLPEVRNQKTHVTIRLNQISENQTRLIFTNDGYGYGGQWDESFAYFQRAWLEIVLPNLKVALEAPKL